MIKLFFKVSEAYPGRYAGLYWKVKEASILTERNGISSVISGKLNINADKADSSVPLFSCTFVSNEPKKSWLSSYSTSSIVLIVQVLCKKLYTYAIFAKVFTYPLRWKSELLNDSMLTTSLKRTFCLRVDIYDNVN